MTRNDRHSGGAPCPTPLTPPPASRNPDTIFVSALLLVAGLGLLISGVEPGSVQELVAGWVATTWAVIIAVAAAFTLAGVLWPDHVAGLFIEAIGRVMLGPSALAYAVAVFEAAGVSGGVTLSLLIALCLSSVWRLWQIRKEIRRLRVSIDKISERQAG